MTDRELPEHFFRREYAKMVAVLSSHFGFNEIDLIEDAAQNALMKAYETWPQSGLPNNTSAWLFKVAQNHVLSEKRLQGNRARLLELNSTSEVHSSEHVSEVYLSDDVQDDLLLTMFACCDDSISENLQLVLILKVLCGFSIKEIAIRLFITEETAYKRLTRARAQFRNSSPSLRPSVNADFADRLPAVLKVLYLMFTEGYLSLSSGEAVRCQICDEAIRLTTLLIDFDICNKPQTRALLALMHLHRARMHTRLDQSGGLLLLEEQNRQHWNREQIAAGLQFLANASEGNDFSRYHAEAGVAAEHCLAPSFTETRWNKVVDYYLILEQRSASPMHTLNRVIALAEWQGAAIALSELKKMQFPNWLVESFWWAAVNADLHLRCDDLDAATQYEEMAARLAPTAAVYRALRRRLKLHLCAKHTKTLLYTKLYDLPE